MELSPAQVDGPGFDSSWALYKTVTSMITITTTSISSNSKAEVVVVAGVLSTPDYGGTI